MLYNYCNNLFFVLIPVPEGSSSAALQRRIASDHRRTMKPCQQVILPRTSLNSQLWGLQSAEGNATTRHEVETGDWCDGPHVTHRRGHDVCGRRTNLE
jgi:hypothetical protein